MKAADAARALSLYILRHAERHNQRTGQYLFNYLWSIHVEEIRGQLWDPFHRDFNQYQLEDWINEHLVFDDEGIIIAVIGSDKVLWERR